jgi:quercetin dioxygenase-like cupin family protein
MRVIEFDRSDAADVHEFASQNAKAVALGHGVGEAHAYCIFLGPEGVIGPHEAGFPQLFVVLDGTAWVAGADGVRRSVGSGQAAYIQRGEIHTKGSEAGLTALMLQVHDFELALGTRQTSA